MATEGQGRLPFLGAALSAALLTALAHGAHLALELDLGPFAAVAYTGLLTPVLILSAFVLAFAARSAATLGWISTDRAENHARLVDWMWRDEPDVLARRSSALVAFVAALTAWMAASWWIGVQILAAVARPPLGLGLLIGTQIGLLAPAAAVYAIVLRPVRATLLAFHDRRLVAPASFFGGAASISIVLAITSWFATDVGEHLPWPIVTGGIAGVVGWLAGRRVRRRTALVAVMLAAFAVCTALTVKMPDSVREDRAIFTSTNGLAAIIYRPLQKALDRDHDGSIHLFGGGDCAPDDPNIHPDALEKLSNGIDEDCSGSDFEADLAFDEAARSHGRPKQLSALPNVVLITTDSLSFTSTSLGREDRDTTPNLARWARQRAVLYESAFSNGPSTRLAFPSIMASVFNSSVGMRRIRTHPYAWDKDTPTIAAALQRAGYRTAMVAPDSYFSSRWKSGVSNGFLVKDHSATKKPKDKVHTSPEVTEAAMRQMRAGKKSKEPLFLWVHYYDHHSPFRRPATGENFGSKKVDIFDSEVEFADRSWGKLFDAIDEELGPNTVVIFTADHGESFDEFHTKKHHGHDLRTPVMWVPLMIAAPGVKPRTVHGLVSHADIPPTIADLTGVVRNPAWTGESLVPTLWQGKEPEKTVVYGLFYLPERHKKGDPFSKISVRTQEWYYERSLWSGAQRLTRWRQDVSGEHNLMRKERETADLMRQLALLKLDALQKKERGLSDEE